MYNYEDIINEAYLEGFMDCLEEFEEWNFLNEGPIQKIKDKIEKNRREKYKVYRANGGKLSYEKWKDSELRSYDEYRRNGGKLSLADWRYKEIEKHNMDMMRQNQLMSIYLNR